VRQRSHHIHDGSETAPRIEVHQSWWAMTGQCDIDGELSVEEKFERISQAGFTGILGRLPVAQDRKRWRRLLDEYRLNFGVNVFPSKQAAYQHTQLFWIVKVSASALQSFALTLNYSTRAPS
jgi:hypothetical protein